MRAYIYNYIYNKHISLHSKKTNSKKIPVKTPFFPAFFTIGDVSRLRPSPASQAVGSPGPGTATWRFVVGICHVKNAVKYQKTW